MQEHINICWIKNNAHHTWHDELYAVCLEKFVGLGLRF
ncbi:hypothetical protein B4168_3446 [Anoxybacillus flavithermus]|nr:hypothetical protein B4168_3446 [Anoxybacillus flavithermus]